MIEGFFNCSIMKRAQNKGLAEIYIHNLRDYTEDKYLSLIHISEPTRPY